MISVCPLPFVDYLLLYRMDVMIIEQFLPDSTLTIIAFAIGILGPIIHMLRIFYRMNQITIFGKPRQWKHRYNIGYSVAICAIGIIYAAFQRPHWQVFLVIVTLVIISCTILPLSHLTRWLN